MDPQAKQQLRRPSRLVPGRWVKAEMAQNLMRRLWRRHSPKRLSNRLNQPFERRRRRRQFFANLNRRTIASLGST